MLGKTQAGTWEGELLRSVARYKGFPMGAFLMHFFRGLDSLRDSEGQWFRGQYLASLVIGTTVMGAASLQLKNLAAGKDPEPMTGDHATFSAQRLDDPARMRTPAGGFALDLHELLFGRLQDAANDHESHTGRKLVQMVHKYTPTVWYTKLAYDRLINATLEHHLDPDYAASFARQAEQAEKTQATQYWWRPGSSEPRMPEFGRAVP